MANRNGLQHKVRGFKGVGFGRALPAPFQFGNGLVPDGVDDYLTIPGLVGKMWPMEGTIEMWFTVPASKLARELEVQFSDGSYLRITAWGVAVPAIEATSRMPSNAAAPNGTHNFGTKYHAAYMWDSTKAYAWSSALNPNTITNGAVATLSSNLNVSIASASIVSNVQGQQCSATKIDELRIYNKKLNISDLELNDNNGIGNNPSNTENLFGWYQFEKFEMLDFSKLQDNSDIRLGLKDASGQNNHARPFNMITDASNINYVLKTFV